MVIFRTTSVNFRYKYSFITLTSTELEVSISEQKPTVYYRIINYFLRKEHNERNEHNAITKRAFNINLLIQCEH